MTLEGFGDAPSLQGLLEAALRLQRLLRKALCLGQAQEVLIGKTFVRVVQVTCSDEARLQGTVDKQVSLCSVCKAQQQ